MSVSTAPRPQSTTDRPRGMARLGAVVVRRRRAVLVLAVLFVAVAGAVGGGVIPRLSSGGFDDTASASGRAAAVLETQFDAAPADLVLVVATTDGSAVDDPAVAGAGAGIAERLAAEPGVEDVTSYWATGSPALRSTAGTTALITARLAGGQDAAQARAGELAAQLSGPADGGRLEVGAAGTAVVFAAVNDTIEHDLARAESIAVPLTLLLLLVVFATVVAAGLPLVIGLVSVLGSFLVLFGLTHVTDVSIFALNLITSLGLGLAIDYSLFLVSRYREELRNGHAPHDAVVRAVATAGRTVLYSGITVAISLAALLVFPQFFLRSFAYAGIATTALAVAAAVLVLPAVLAVLGTRVERWRVLPHRREDHGSEVNAEHGFWYRLSTAVMRRPWAFLLSGLTVLVLLGLPFLGVTFGQTDDRVLPASDPAAVASSAMREDFDARESAPITVVVPDSGTNDGTAAADYAERLSTLPGVVRVDSAAGSFAHGALVAPPTQADARFSAAGGTWLSVVADVEPFSGEGRELVEQVRATPAPYDEVLVGGASASFVDSQDALGSRLPWALGIIAVATFVLLFLFTGSVVLPLKALALTTLSLSATFGAMVFVFQQGHLQWLVGDFQVTGVLDTSVPILMFCIAFGLSMDYEVFLLSRIKEEYDRTGDNTRAVAFGLQRTGRLVTSAALLLSIVFIAFATSGVTLIKMLGVGVALAVIMDATLVRALLVPAFMRIAGDLNWWAPRPLKHLHARFGLSEADPHEPAHRSQVAVG